MLDSIYLLIHLYIGGGGLSSLQIDRQGKTYAQMLLSFKVDVPPGLFAKL